MIKVDVPHIDLKNNEKIPRIIHYCWFGGKTLPKDVKKYIKTWKKYLPDYKIICWNEDSFDITAHPYTREAYENKKWAFITDYVRLYVLYHIGGIYMDSDIEITKPLDAFLTNSAFTCFEPENYIYPEKIVIQTGLIASNVNNIWISRLLSYYDNRHFISKDGTLNILPNPIPVTEITIKEFGLIPNQLFQNLDDIVTIYPKDFFCPINWETLKFDISKNTHAIHHFAGSWIDGKEKEKYIKLRKRAGELLGKIIGGKLYRFIAENTWRKYLDLK